MLESLILRHMKCPNGCRSSAGHWGSALSEAFPLFPEMPVLTFSRCAADRGDRLRAVRRDLSVCPCDRSAVALPVPSARQTGGLPARYAASFHRVQQPARHPWARECGPVDRWRQGAKSRLQCLQQCRTQRQSRKQIWNQEHVRIQSCTFGRVRWAPFTMPTLGEEALLFGASLMPHHINELWRWFGVYLEIRQQ